MNVRLAHNASAADLVEPLGLDQRERGITIEACIVREEGALLAALT